MFWSAVSVSIAMAASATPQAAALKPAWASVAPSVIRLKQGITTVGSAVLIDSSGYFLAHRSMASVGMLTGIAQAGDAFPLMRVSTDDATGLVLLKATLWQHRSAKPIRPTAGAPKAGTPVFIVMNNGLEMGEISNPNRGGVMPQSPNRLVFLTEVKLENPTPNLGGAPVFTYGGEFVGLLNANLPSSSAKQGSQAAQGLGNSLTRQQEPFRTADIQSKSFASSQNYGPSSLFVAYALGPEMLQRVISGFLSPSHEVQHPFIGLYIRDGQKGAEIQAINPNSPAAKSDLKPGDLILSVGGTSISNRLDYARAMLHLKVGDSVPIVYIHDGVEKTVQITVVRSAR